MTPSAFVWGTVLLVLIGLFLVFFVIGPVFMIYNYFQTSRNAP